MKRAIRSTFHSSRLSLPASPIIYTVSSAYDRSTRGTEGVTGVGKRISDEIRYETRTIIKELSPEVIDGVRLIISFFTGPSSVMLLLSLSLPRSRRRYDCRECRRQGM